MFGAVLHGFIQGIPELFPGLFFAGADVFSQFQSCPFFGNFRHDLKYIIGDQHPVFHRFPVAVIADQILIEIAKSPVVGRSTQTDLKGIEIVEHLFPEVVNASVTLVYDDKIKKLRGRTLAVHHWKGLFGNPFFIGIVFFLAFVELGSFENGIEALNGADIHLTIARNEGTAQAGDPIQFGKKPVVVLRFKTPEFLICLFAQIFSIHQKQDPFRLGEFKQSVNKCDGRKGLARARCHLDQGFWATFPERMFQIGNGCDLTIPESVGLQGWNVIQTCAEGSLLFDPFLKGFRAVETEFQTGTWFGILSIGEPRHFARAFVQETKGFVVQVLEFGGGIITCLIFYRGESHPFFGALGFNHPHRLLVYKKHIIHRANIGEVFTHGNSERSTQVNLCFVLNDPAAANEQLVDMVAGELFWILVVHGLGLGRASIGPKWIILFLKGSLLLGECVIGSWIHP